MSTPHASWRHDGERRLRVVVADNSPLILEKASALLATDFEVVAAVTNGRQALRAALRLDPEVVVLDVAMPELNGLQTAVELKRLGSRSKIVMLTMHELDGYVAAAIKSGAQGYVVKTRMMSDLAGAIDHAIAGRLFVPSLTSLLAVTPTAGAGWHSVQFGIDDRVVTDHLSGLLATALQHGDVAAIVANDATRADVAGRLIANGCDIARAADRSQFISLDVTAALSQVMVSGRPDVGRVAAIVDDLERSRVAASASQLMIVGEMAPRLCRDGHPEAALELERVWSDLTRRLPFFTVCFYSPAHVGGSPDVFHGICAAHSAVCHAHDPRNRQ